MVAAPFEFHFRAGLAKFGIHQECPIPKLCTRFDENLAFVGNPVRSANISTDILNLPVFLAGEKGLNPISTTLSQTGPISSRKLTL
jgi:hypothetical protein